MAVLAAVIRGFSRRSATTLGNFWVDLYRSLAYILVPLAIVAALVLVSQGVVQTFDGHATATTVEGGEQLIARGPAASQIAIKQLGTNGGGFYNSNSAVPFENPTAFTSFLELLLDPADPGSRSSSCSAAWSARCGRRGRSSARCSRSSRSAVAIALPGRAARLAGAARLRRQPHARRRLERREHGRQGGPLRHRRDRPLFAVGTTNASNGSVNGGHDALTAPGGAVPIVNMFIGEVIFGGVGSGLYGMLLYVLIAVFVAGLMVGRTPEYLGKKIEAREIKLAVVGALFVPTMVLVLTAISVVTRPRARVDLQPGRARLHRGALRLRLAGEQQRQRVRRLRRDRVLGATWARSRSDLGRFVPLIAALALAGSLAAKKIGPGLRRHVPHRRRRPSSSCSSA